jgi:hypothetical protein
MTKQITLLTIVLAVLAGCGSVSDQQNGSGCASGGGCAVICQTDWNYQKAHGGTTFDGSYYCQGGTQVYALFSRDGQFVPVANGTHTAAETGLPCSFAVSSSCQVTEQ